jgi:hypothetical protein
VESWLKLALSDLHTVFRNSLLLNKCDMVISSAIGPILKNAGSTVVYLGRRA